MEQCCGLHGFADLLLLRALAMKLRGADWFGTALSLLCALDRCRAL